VIDIARIEHDPNIVLAKIFIEQLPPNVFVADFFGRHAGCEKACGFRCERVREDTIADFGSLDSTDPKVDLTNFWVCGVIYLNIFAETQ
jgi:hypothetical protein